MKYEEELHISAATDTNHTSKSTIERLYRSLVDSDGVYNGSDLWRDQKRAVHRRCKCRLTNLERFYKEEWANFVTSRCAVLFGLLPKKSECCNKSQRCCNKVLVYGCEYLCIWVILSFLFNIFPPLKFFIFFRCIVQVVGHIKGEKCCEIICHFLSFFLHYITFYKPCI